MTRPLDSGDRLPVLLPFRLHGSERHHRLGAGSGVLLCVGVALLVSTASAQAGRVTPSVLQVIAKWTPLLLTGFAFNILISALAMLLGTILGLGLGLGLLSDWPPVRQVSWALTQIFRNAPWLVLLFFVMFLVPFQITMFGLRIPFPDWIKATVGFALPVMANVARWCAEQSGRCPRPSGRRPRRSPSRVARPCGGSSCPSASNGCCRPG